MFAQTAVCSLSTSQKATGTKGQRGWGGEHHKINEAAGTSPVTSVQMQTLLL